MRYKMEGLFGNVIIACLISIGLLYGPLAVRSLNSTVIVLSALAFFSNLGREITQSIADAEGDRIRGVKSVPLVHGPRIAASLSSVRYVLVAFPGRISFSAR